MPMRFVLPGQRLLVRMACLLVALTLSLPSSAADDVADVVSGALPESVAADYYALSRRGDWAGVVALTDPAAIDGFRGRLLDFAGRHVIRKEEMVLMEGDPIPVGVLQAHVTAFFGPVTTIDEVAALRPSVLLARALDEMSRIIGPRIERLQILGQVVEGAERVHVLVRTESPVANGRAFTDYDVLTLHRTTGGWRVESSLELSALDRWISPSWEKIHTEGGGADTPMEPAAGASRP